MIDIKSIKDRLGLTFMTLNERARRLAAGAEAIAAGYGGVSAVSRATGMCRNAISRGMKECQEGLAGLAPERVRAPGAGRKTVVFKDAGLIPALDALIEPTTRRDPESTIRWTCDSTRTLSDALTAAGHPASSTTVGNLLHEQGYSLQANQKTRDGNHHPDRNAQFEHIHAEVSRRQAMGQPVISVDAKKKELIGNFKNAGREWRKKGQPREVNVHDFVDIELGKALPYGVYDLSHNTGWVSVGTTHDTAAFAVETVRRWWRDEGRLSYPGARTLLITADSGGSNGARLRLWKWELQKLANETGIAITVNHLPPGTSKWNKIEHRLFSFISQNWRGKPLISRAVIVSLIGATTTRTGLKVRCQLDDSQYDTGIRISNKSMKLISLERDSFHGEWNYTIRPNDRAT